MSVSAPTVFRHSCSESTPDMIKSLASLSLSLTLPSITPLTCSGQTYGGHHAFIVCASEQPHASRTGAASREARLRVSLAETRRCPHFNGGMSHSRRFTLILQSLHQISSFPAFVVLAFALPSRFFEFPCNWVHLRLYSLQVLNSSLCRC